MSPYRFEVATESTDGLDLRRLCETYIHGIWISDHLLPHEAEEFDLDHFTRVVMGYLEMLTVCCRRERETE